MSELPQGWAATQLGELASSIVGGGTPSKSNADYFRGTVPFMTVKDMHARFIVDTQDHITEEALEDSASRLIPADTLVVASRMSLGKTARPTVSVAINQDLKAIFLHEGIDKTYVEYAWRAKESDIQGMGTGTTVKGIRLEDIRGLDIALAPSGEQTRIANQLDTMLARVQACNDRFDAIPALLKRFRQTVLDAATSGRLTEDWRLNSDQCDAGDGHGSVVADLPSGWRWSCPEEIKAGDRHALAIGPFGSSLKVSDYKSEGVPLVFVREIRSRNSSSGSTKFISFQKAEELKAHSIQGGDLLITKMGDPPGDIAIYPKGAPRAVITADCVRLRVDDSVALAAFVGYTIECTDTRERLRDITAGVAQRKISLSRFRHFQLPIAPLREQAEIVRRVEALFAMADRIETRCAAARVQAQRLTPLVLAKAFRGELVPQDPNDEPASELLARIGLAKTAVAAKLEKKAPVGRN